MSLLPQDPEQAANLAPAIAISKGLEKAEDVVDEAYKAGVMMHTGHHPDGGLRLQGKNDNYDRKTADNREKGGENEMVDRQLEQQQAKFVRAIEESISSRDDVEQTKRGAERETARVVRHAQEVIDELTETEEHASDLYDEATRYAEATDQHYQDIEGYIQGMADALEDAADDLENAGNGSPPDLGPVTGAIDRYEP